MKERLRTCWRAGRGIALFSLCVFSGCDVKPLRSVATVAAPQVSQLSFSSTKIDINGINLDNVNELAIEGEGRNYPFVITGKNAIQIEAYPTTLANFLIGGLYRLTLVSAKADQFGITFQLTNGSVTPAILDRAYMPLSGATLTGALTLPSNGLTVGTDQLVVSGGNVGIGTISPAQKLSVAGVIESTTGGVKFPDGSTLGSGAVVFLTYDLAAGSGEATPTAGSWQTRSLNTEVADTAGISTLSANQFTLPAGTYKIETSQVFFSQSAVANQFHSRVRNVTDSTTVAVGAVCRLHIPNGSSANDVCPGFGVFTITATKTFELQYYIENSLTNGLGYNLTNTGEVERFAHVMVQRLN